EINEDVGHRRLVVQHVHRGEGIETQQQVGHRGRVFKPGDENTVELHAHGDVEVVVATDRHAHVGPDGEDEIHQFRHVVGRRRVQLLDVRGHVAGSGEPQVEVIPPHAQVHNVYRGNLGELLGDEVMVVGRVPAGGGGLGQRDAAVLD